MQSVKQHKSKVWNFRILREAADRHSCIDLIDGEEILLHLKVVPELERLVINNRADQGWGKEIRLPVPAALMEHYIDIELRQEGDHFLVGLLGGDSTPYDRNADRLHAAQLRLSNGVLRLPPKSTLEIEALEARITRADIMHVAGEILYPDLHWTHADRLRGAQLLLLIDGRLSGSIPLPQPRTDHLTLSANFVLELDAGAFVSDGMTAEIVLLIDGTRRVLAASHLHSQFSGALERCTESIVAGFVCNEDFPNRPVLVDIFLNDVFQATIPANMNRPDLGALEPAAGRAGFEFRFAKPVHLPVSRDIWVSARIHNMDLELANSPWWICRAVSMTDLLLDADVGLLSSASPEG
jgi:hypothetical protein